jgi:hypothetical protein
MDSIKPGQDPSILQGMDAVAIAKPFGGAGGHFRQSGAGERPPRRIEGLFCPFCTGRIPEEFVFCLNCGRDA